MAGNYRRIKSKESDVQHITEEDKEELCKLLQKA